MPLPLHQTADKWFASQFGINYRSEALFISSSTLVASSYACNPESVVRVIPIGPYRYCWSKKRSDLLFYCSSNQDTSIDDYLLNGEYIEADLKGAHDSGNEVMLYCERYVAIPIGLLQSKGNEPVILAETKLILP